MYWNCVLDETPAYIAHTYVYICVCLHIDEYLCNIGQKVRNHWKGIAELLNNIQIILINFNQMCMYISF